MFSYDNFRELVKSDGMAKLNRFYCLIAMPRAGNLNLEKYMYDSGGSSKRRNLHVLCKSVSIPGMQIASSPIRYTGEIFNAPYDRTFGPASLTFYVDRQFYVKQFFDEWMSLIQNPFNRTMGYYNDFISQIRIAAMDKNDTDTYHIILHDAHPKSMSTITLDQGTNGIMEITVDFDFHYYSTHVIEMEQRYPPSIPTVTIDQAPRLSEQRYPPSFPNRQVEQRYPPSIPQIKYPTTKPSFRLGEDDGITIDELTSIGEQNSRLYGP